MSRRPTISELRWPQTPEFVAAARELAENVVATMIGALWAGYDKLREEVLEPIGLPERGDEAERQLTQLLHVRVDSVLTGYEPFTCRHAYREFETRLEPPAQAPEYDIAFVLRFNERICWPVEAKVVATERTTAAYVRDVREEFLTCRYGPFSSSGAMIAYMLGGKPAAFFRNVGAALPVEMVPVPWIGERPHRVSLHERTVPLGKSYPKTFECYHLAMPVR